MPRHRHTFALILISFTILATVITAFRVRDLPKSDLKSSARKQKCKDCGDSEVNLDPKLHSFRVDGGKRVYEDLKKAVREKQKQIRLKSPEFKFEFSHEDDDDEDDDDSDFIVEKVKSISKESFKVGDLKIFKSSLPEVDVYEDNNDDDDDDEDDDSDRSGNKHLKKDSNKKVTSQKHTSKLTTNQEKIKTDKNKDKEEEDDDDDDDDDEGENDNIIKKSNPQKHRKDSKESHAPNDGLSKTSNQKVNTDKIKKTNPLIKQDKVDDQDDNDEDDDNDDEDEADDKFNEKVLMTKSNVNKKLQDKNTIKKNIFQNDDDDEIDDGKHNLPNFNKKDKTDKLHRSSPKDPAKSVSHDTLKDESATHKDKTVNPTKTGESNTKQNPTSKVTEIQPPPKTDKEKIAEVKTKPETEKHTNKEPKPDHLKPIDHKPNKEESKESKEVTKIKSVKSSSREEDKNLKHDSEDKKKEDLSKDHKKSEKKEHKRDKTSIEMTDSEDIVQRHEAYLKQVTDALHRRNLLQSEFEDFYAFFPTFAPNFSRIHNPECRRHGQILLRQLRGTKLWALNMLDSTAKIPSGILQGNGIQLGDFDQCLGSHARVQLESGSVVRVQGKYCLARIDIKAEHPELELPVHLAQAKNLFKSRIDDPGHFVPRFSTLSWGVCVPAACNPEDVEIVIRDTVKHYQHTSGVLIRVKVDEDDCHVEESDWWEKFFEIPTILTLSLYGIIILLVIIATVKDLLGRRGSDEQSGADEGDEKNDEQQEENNDKEKEKDSESFINAFSLYRNVKKLSTPGLTDDIACIHGVRGLATIALLVAHKIMPVAVMPYTNRVRITEIASSAIWSWARTGWVFTDCFLLLSGALTAYRVTVDSETSALKRICLRYLRLTPALLAIVLFYAYIWDNIGSGPMWGTLVTKNAEVCQQDWWWNLLYVQNYFGFEEMCAPQTHQLALDMQLTLLSGIIIWCIQGKPGASKIALLIIHGVTAYSRYTTVRDHRLTLIAYHGVSVSQLYRTARLTYTSTFHRSTAYLVGISLGLALQNPAKHGKMLLTLGWLVSTGLWTMVWWFGYDAGYPTYHYNPAFAAQYAALAPIASSLAIAWLIYAVHIGGDGWLSRFLCCWPLVFVSRLSYAIYLCQFIVYLTNAATVRTSSEFTLTRLLDIQEMTNILLVSTLLTVTFVMPMQSILKLRITWFSKPGEEELGDKTENPNEPPDNNGTKFEIDDRNGRVEVPTVRRSHLIAHREILEEIPEVEIEYEIQREHTDGLEEIIEEEEDEEATDRDLENALDEDEDMQILDDDMEVIEEEPEEEGGEDFWNEREEYRPRRSFRFNDDDDPTEEQDYTASTRNGTQQYRFSR